MNLAALFHRPSREYVLPTSINSITVRILCEKSDIKNLSIIYWKRNSNNSIKTQKLDLYCSDEFKDDFRTTLTFNERSHYIQYYFKLENDNDIYYLSSEEVRFKTPPIKGFFEYLFTNTNEIFTLPNWSDGITYYQIFPDRFSRDSSVNEKNFVPWTSIPNRTNYFGGTLLGICKKINYLSNLGVEAIYLCPIFEANFNHRYATINYFKIDQKLGTNNDLKTLVKTCHDKNIKIILDGVFNHVSTDFIKFKKFKKNNKYISWFFPIENKTDSKLTYECVGDYLPMPKLRTSSTEVRNYIYKIMKYWVSEYDIDGWRLDVADEIDITTLQFIRLKFKKQFPNHLLLGETWGDGFRNVGMGDQLDCIMNYQLREIIKDLFALNSINCIQFKNRIGHLLSCYHDIVNHSNYNMLSSHDVARYLTICKEDINSFHLSICFQMTFLGSPAIYYGDENNMLGENDPGCRGPMNFIEDGDTFNLYKTLINLRKNNLVLKKGNFKFIDKLCNEKIFVFQREYRNETAIIIFNLDNKIYKSKIFGKVIFEYSKDKTLLNTEIYPRSMKIILKEEENNEN